MLSIENEIKEVNQSENKGESLKKQYSIINNEIKALETKLYLLQVFDVYSEMKGLIENRYFEKIKITHIRLKNEYSQASGDFKVGLTLLQKKNNEWNKYFTVNQSIEKKLYYLFNIAINRSHASIDLLEGNNFEIEVNENMLERIVNFYLSPEAKSIFNYSMLAAQIENKNKDILGRSKI